VIRLGFRLAVGGGREAITRLVMIAAAVAIGSCLLLATLAGLRAVHLQNDRYAWLETGFTRATQPVDDALDPVWWRLRGDMFDGEVILRVDVAPTGPDAPIPPGVPALPGPDEMYVSPALAELLDRTPAEQLDDRYQASVVGTIGREALASPDSLVAIVGYDTAELAAARNTAFVTEISTVGPDACEPDCALFIGTTTAGMTLILGVVAAALLFPVLVFIASAARLSAARREQRFAAMRLVGATPRQVAVVAAVEAALAACAGVVVGFGLFVALRPLIAELPFTSERFFAGDLTISARDALLVGVGIPAAAAVAAGVALRRVIASPLGITRQASARPARARRLMPLVAGFAWLAYLAWFSDIGSSRNPEVQAVAYLTGIFSIMIGLVVAGPWLTAIAAHLTARRATRPAALLASRRLGDDPHSAFRAISGVVLAVFVASCAIGVITSVVANNGGSADASSEDRGTVLYEYDIGGLSGHRGASFDDGDHAEMLAIPGVEGVIVLYEDTATDESHLVVGSRPFLAQCDQLATAPALGRCPEGAGTAHVQLRLGGAIVDDETPMADITWPAADRGPDQLGSLTIASVGVATDGSRAAVERARTVLERSLPVLIAPPLTIAEYRAINADDVNQFRRLADVVLLAGLVIAGCNLAVNVAGGVAERRRPFSMLRLTGVPLATLRRVVAIEAVVPLLSSIVIAAGAGLVVADLFLRAQTHYELEALGPQYYVLLAGGVLVALAIIAVTLPLLDRTTGPDAARLS
jgi:FtsX-like permease family